MLIAGANRHAKEVLEILYQSDMINDLYFFDDISVKISDRFLNVFPIIRSLEIAEIHFRKDVRFILGLGNPINRYTIYKKLSLIGGDLISIIAKTSIIGHYEVNLGKGLNIMNFALISNSVSIGAGSLINAYASIHHDVKIGNYCEISPRATILGGVVMGDFCSVGSGAVILPDVSIGNNVVIGAGAVITKSIPSNKLVVGIPGRIIKDILSPEF